MKKFWIPVPIALHKIRTLFRFRCFENLFYHPKRRDSEWLRETVGIDESLQAFARVDLVNNEADLTGAENCCPMCAAALGTHQHTFWECPQNPIPTGRPPITHCSFATDGLLWVVTLTPINYTVDI